MSQLSALLHTSPSTNGLTVDRSSCSGCGLTKLCACLMLNYYPDYADIGNVGSLTKIFAQFGPA